MWSPMGELASSMCEPGLILVWTMCQIGYFPNEAHMFHTWLTHGLAIFNLKYLRELSGGNKKGHSGNPKRPLFIISPYSLINSTRKKMYAFTCDRKIKTNKKPAEPGYITIIRNTQNHLIQVVCYPCT
jgi:hypothetical protein